MIRLIQNLNSNSCKKLVDKTTIEISRQNFMKRKLDTVLIPYNSNIESSLLTHMKFLHKAGPNLESEFLQ